MVVVCQELAIMSLSLDIVKNIKLHLALTMSAPDASRPFSSAVCIFARGGTPSRHFRPVNGAGAASCPCAVTAGGGEGRRTAFFPRFPVRLPPYDSDVHISSCEVEAARMPVASLHEDP